MIKRAGIQNMMKYKFSVSMPKINYTLPKYEGPSKEEVSQTRD